MTQAKMTYAMVGDGESPHLLKWARALAPLVHLHICSSRGFSPELAALLPEAQRLAMNSRPEHGGGNGALLKKLPLVARWLKQVDADWINPHYLTSHGTLVLLAKRYWRLRGRVVASAWGSDILVTPKQHAAYRWLTQMIVRNATLCTSDSQHMAQEMRALGAQNVMVFPFGLEGMPPAPQQKKEPWLFFANRGLEPIYQSQRVLALFASMAQWQPQARLVVANDGSLRAGLEQWVQQHGLSHAVQFVGRLDAATQARYYDQAQWYMSLPQSDSVAVSVLEAMAHGCIALLSDLPANHELVQSGDNGLIVPSSTSTISPEWLQPLHQRAAQIAQHNRQWVQHNGLFAPAVAHLVHTLQTLA